jgi:hypothetical protein
MENDYISKKELLELTGISYGQLYRWKRKSLIPEEWFIKKSAFTGQETFFPRDKILARVKKIMDMKEDVSLDDLADVFSPNLNDLNLGADELIQKGIVTGAILDIYNQITGGGKNYLFDDILNLYALEKLLGPGEISLDEGRLLITTLVDNRKNYKSGYCEVFLARKLGTTICFLVSSPNEICFEKGVKIAGRLSITALVEELKLKLI